MIRLKLRFDNPGEFLASCGLLYLCDCLYQSRVATGVTLPDRPTAFFKAKGELVIKTDLSLNQVLQQLCNSVIVEQNDSVLLLLDDSCKLELNWWKEKAKSLKWGGHNTPLEIVQKLLNEIRRQILKFSGDFFSRIPLSTYFGLDALNPLRKTGYNPRDAGCKIAISPTVELLGAIGLQYFYFRWRNAGFCYSVWGEDSYSLPLEIAKLASAGLIEPALLAEFEAKISLIGSVKVLQWATRKTLRVGE